MKKLSHKAWLVIWISSASVLFIALVIIILAILGQLPRLSWHLFRQEQNARQQEQEIPEAYSVYNGLPITKMQAGQRAVGVMIAGDPVTRPQSGLGLADVVIEMEAASGITRFLAIFQSNYPEEIGSIRSVRNDYIDLAEGLDAVLVHWGGEKKALNRLALGGVDEINEFSQGDLFYRDFSIAPPHNGFTSGELMQKGLSRLGLDQQPEFEAWQFSDEKPVDQRLLSGTLKINFGNPNFNVRYQYDGETNDYKRSQGGQEHKEALTGQVIAPKNVLVMRAERFTYDPIGGYLQFDITAGGACTLYTQGQEIPCHWQKGQENNPVTFLSQDNLPLKFTRGQLYIEILPKSDQVEWTAAAQD